MTPTPPSMPPPSMPPRRTPTSMVWRGRFEEQNSDLPIDEALPRRREARQLLAELLRPYSAAIGLLAVVVIVENVAGA